MNAAKRSFLQVALVLLLAAPGPLRPAVDPAVLEEAGRAIYRRALMAASRGDARERIQGAARHDDAPIPLLKELADRYPHTRMAPEALYAVEFLHMRAGAHGPAVAA